MAGDSVTVSQGHFVGTLRRDAWWTEILPAALLLGVFGAYATWRAFEGKFYEWGPYLSPFYSPLIDASHHFWPWSPALLILAFPLGFRTTCYYYRKAYYRAYFMDPPACAVGERKRNYCGETKFPFILQNLHRYFLYAAIIVLAFLWYDAIVAFMMDGHFFVGVGSLIMLANVILLSIYTGSCHSLRHLVGGKVDCFSCSSFGSTRHSWWQKISSINEHHMLYAWCSLISVGSTDLYIRLVSAGIIRDIRIL
jgi:hypothetical protein